MKKKYKIDRIALTGATSTIGTAIVRECISNGIEVLALVNKNSLNISRIPYSQLITIIECSLQDMENLNTEGMTAEVFFHLAWGNTNRLVRNEAEPQIENIKYSLDSVRLASRLGCEVYVGAGSQAEYGRVEGIIDEETAVHPETAYGIAKLCSGQMTRIECEKLGIRHIWPRIFSTYGPYTQDSTILNYTIRELLNKHRPSLTKCEQTWDFLYVDDAARALLLLAEKGRNGEIYCISSGRSDMLRHFIEIICTELKSSIEIGFGDLDYGENTVMHLAGDISKVRKETGFTPLVSFKEGIDKTIEWAKEYYDYEKN